MAVTAVVGAVGLGLAAYGAYKQAQAQKLAKANLANRPVYNSLPEDDSELRLAEQQANQGMGAGARQALQNNTDRQLASSTNAILMGGGNANAISSLAQNTQNAYNNNAIYDDQARQQHLGTLLNTYAAYNSQRQANADKSFQYNQDAPWKDRQQLYASQIAGGQQTMNSGINIAGKAFGGMQSGGNSDNVQPQYSGSNTQGAWSHPEWGQPATMGGYNPGEYGAGEGNFNFSNSGAGGNSGGYQWNGITPFYSSGN